MLYYRDDFRGFKVKRSAPRPREEVLPFEDSYTTQWKQIPRAPPSPREREQTSPLVDPSDPRFPPSREGIPIYSETQTPPSDRRPSTPGRTSKQAYQNFSRRRQPVPTSPGPTYLIYPPPSNPPIAKPLPPLPPAASTFYRAPSKSSSKGSVATSEFAFSRHSQSSKATTEPDHDDFSYSFKPPPTAVTPTRPLPPPPPRIPADRPKPQQEPSAPDDHPSALRLSAWRRFAFKDKAKDPGVYYLDASSTSKTLASKHGSTSVTFWNVATGEAMRTVKISSYTQAGARGRGYFIRSHAILSEQSTLAALATGFGNNIEVWNWAKDKHVQSISGADRWAAKRSDLFESAWPPLAVYNGDSGKKTIDLYGARRDKKKPFAKAYAIDLQAAGLPFLLQYPELAFSATGPLLVAAAGPRPPRVGNPPPERSTLLVAWDLSADGAGGPVSSKPYRMIKPWQHAELDTALPCSLAVYGSVVVSIWIPAGVRAVPVPAHRGGQGYNLVGVPVPQRHVLVWDFSAASTRTFAIPNTTSAVSPDCRFVAYCDAAGTGHGARGKLAVLDALSGRQMWCWPDPDAGELDSAAHAAGFEQLADLSRVLELAFSEDGGILFVGDTDGLVCGYNIREVGDKRLALRPRS